MGHDWNDLRYFLACWRSGSLAGAGRSLKVDQTTVGRRLAGLEEALGARLFERAPGGLVLTPIGERLLETAQQVEQGAIDIERHASGADERLEGVVRVATSETLAATFLTRELSALHAEHPGIELQLVTGTVSLNLLRRESDIALRVGQRPTQQSLVVRRLGAISWAVFGHRDTRARHPVPGPLGPLDGYDVVAMDEELAQIPSARWMVEHGAGARVVLRTNSILSAAEAVSAGWGVAALPLFVGAARPELVRIFSEPITPNDLWLVVHPDLQHVRRIRAVLDHLARAVGRAKVVDMAP